MDISTITIPEEPAPQVEPKKAEGDKWLAMANPKWLSPSGNLVAPKNYIDNLKYRVWLRGVNHPNIDGDHKIKSIIWRQCRDDILFFFNTYLFTQDPRKSPSDLPFITYDYEDQYITWVLNHIKTGKDCLTEKSRDMGVSWCLCGILIHRWIFTDGFLGHIGSKKEDDVDRSGDIRSLFEKLRYMIKELPVWLRPYQFDIKKHSNFMRILNPYNNNSITGESSNRDFGRGGRYTLVMLDEFASMEYADEAWTSTGDSTKCRIAVSTPKGTGNKFWQLRFKSNIDYFTAHWTMHPEKAKDAVDKKDGKPLDRVEAFDLWKKGHKVSSPWYEGEINRRLTTETQSRVDIAQELDIDYIASGNPYFDMDALKKQKEWEVTNDWLYFDETKQKVIIGKLVEVDNKLEFQPDKNGWLRLFERPRAGSQYVVGVDAAEGLEHGDYCSAACRDKRTRNLTAAIYCKYDYDELAYDVSLLSRFFNNALVAAEAGGYGAAVNKRLYDLGVNVSKAVDFSSGSTVEKDKLGWMNTTTSRPLALGDMEAEIREGSCELRDKNLLTECSTFVNKDGKPQASEGSNDDFIWAFAIAGQLLRFRPYSKELEKESKKQSKFASYKPPRNMGFSFVKRK